MREPFELLVARINASAYLPPTTPTADEVSAELRSRIMAKQVKLPKGKEFTFKSAAGGQASKYPWDEWFSGNLLLIERSDVDAEGNVTGEKRDFEVDRDAMPAKLKTAARRRYKIVQISKRDHEGKPLENSGLIIKARDMDATERLAEDQLRAEEKAARKAANAEAATDAKTEAAA